MVSTTVLVSKQGILGQASMTNLWIGKVKQKKNSTQQGTNTKDQNVL